jgi:hypothetical protein
MVGNLWQMIFSGMHKRRLVWAIFAVILSTGLLPLPLQQRAEAGIFDFLIGGRENRRGRPPNRDKGGAVRAGRLAGGVDASIPYIITPRNTFEETQQVTIRWNPVPDAETYTVRLWQWEDANGGRQQVIWETTTADTTVTYGGDPPLAPESFYSVEVITDQGISSDLDVGCPISGFALLFPETRAQLQDDLRGLALADLTDEELALARSQVYLSYQMPAAAIATLTPQFNSAPTAPLTLALAELYSYAGLNALALDHYTQGLALAETARDDLWQAIAQEGLGEVNVVLDQISEAIPPLQRAKLLYTVADQPIDASRVDRRIEILRLGQQLAIAPTDTLQGCDPRTSDR